MQKRKHATTLSANAPVLLLVLVFFQLLAFAAGDSPRPGRAEKLRIVDLEGTLYQMGKIHGQALKTEIRVLVDRWKEDLEKTYRVPADAFIRNLLKKTDFKPAAPQNYVIGEPDGRGAVSGPRFSSPRFGKFSRPRTGFQTLTIGHSFPHKEVSCVFDRQSFFSYSRFVLGPPPPRMKPPCSFSLRL